MCSIITPKPHLYQINFNRFFVFLFFAFYMQIYELNSDDINNNNRKNVTNLNDYIINDVDNVYVDDSNLFDTNYVFERINRRNSAFSTKNINNVNSNYKLYFDDESNNIGQNVNSKNFPNNDSVSTKLQYPHLYFCFYI